MSGLLSIFNTAKRGLAAQQYSISVTNHNVANANTEGYSRQRAILQTSSPYMNPSMNSYIGPGQLGTGVEVATVQRIRNEFIDFQIRGEYSTQGKYQSREALLSEVEYIFNEPTDSAISGLIGKFYDSWQQLSKQPQSSNARTVVAQQSKALTDELNHTYGQLEKLKDNTNRQIKENVFKINNVLDQLDSLNQQIVSVKVSEQEPNDLMDKRDLLMDELSRLMDLDVKKRPFYGVDIAPGTKSGLPGGAESVLVRKEPNMAVSRFSYINGIGEVRDGSGNLTGFKFDTYKLGNSNEEGETLEVAFDSGMSEEEKEELLSKIEETRVLWANEKGVPYAQINKGSGLVINNTNYKEALGLFEPDKGSVNGLQSVQKDVDKYMDQMNKLAKGIAMAVNVVHSGVVDLATITDPFNPDDYMDGDGRYIDGKKIDMLPFFVNKETEGKGIKEILKGETKITAGNISINEEILKDVMKIKTKTDDDKFVYTRFNELNGNTDGNRALAIAQLRNSFFKITAMDKNITRSSFVSNLTGGNLEANSMGVKTIKNNKSGTTTDNYFKDVIDELGIQTQEAKRIVKNQSNLISGFQQARESASGVSLDEEMANLIQYQHAYSANAKVVSTVDELLDVVVNGLKR